MTEFNKIAQGTEAEAVATLVKDLHKPAITLITSPDGTPLEIMTIPNGMEAKSLKRFHDEYKAKPDRRNGTAYLNDLSSFIAHVTRHKDDDSVIFCKLDIIKGGGEIGLVVKSHMQCVYDYNIAGDDGLKARFGKHRAIYNFPISNELKAWLGQNAETLDTLEFAEFLEDRVIDVAHITDEEVQNLSQTTQKFISTTGGNIATPQKLLELSRGLKINSDESVHQATNLSSGEAAIQFKSEHKDDKGKPVKIPNVFLINIPLFKNGPIYQIAIRLRYRLRTGNIVWFYQMFRPELSLEDAFNEAIDSARKETGLMIFDGAPEDQNP